AAPTPSGSEREAAASAGQWVLAVDDAAPAVDWTSCPADDRRLCAWPQPAAARTAGWPLPATPARLEDGSRSRPTEAKSRSSGGRVHDERARRRGGMPESSILELAE